MFKIEFTGYKSEKTRWLEDFLSSGKNSESLNYNSFEGEFCGLVCAKGKLSFSTDRASEPNEIMKKLFKEMHIDENQIKRFQSALADCLRGICAIATREDFRFKPNWYDDVMSECNMWKFVEEGLSANVNPDDILKKNFPDMFEIDNNSAQSNNVMCWVDGFLSGLDDSDILEKMYEDEIFSLQLAMLASLRDNCYYVNVANRNLQYEDTLKLIDFYKMAYKVPLMVSMFYDAIQVVGRYQSKLPPKRQDPHITRKRRVKERLRRRRRK
jgi:hypothetical protein